MAEEVARSREDGAVDGSGALVYVIDLARREIDLGYAGEFLGIRAVASLAVSHREKTLDTILNSVTVVVQ